MHTPLGIPLEHPATTRRADRRVVLLCIAVLTGALFGYAASRMPSVMAETIGLQPENTVISIRFLRTAANTDIIERQFGGIVPLEGLPIALDELLSMSKHEMTLHANNEQITGIAIDTTISKEMQQTLYRYGFQAWNGHKRSLITRANEKVHDTGSRFALGAVKPWHDGDITTYAKEESRIVFSLTRRHMTIHGLGTPGSTVRNLSIPSSSTVILAASMAEKIVGRLAVTEGTESISALYSLSHTLADEGAYVIFTEDEEGIGYFATFPAASISVEQAARMGKDLANRQSLSTTELTTEDGTSFREIVTSRVAASVDISAEQDFTFITITSKEGEVLRITKTPEVLTISNRAIAVTDTHKAKSSCLSNAHTWVKADKFQELMHPEVEHQQILHELLANTDEIATNASKIRICW